MKRRCRLCNKVFETKDPWKHVCDECWDEEPEELADPALKARIEEKVRQRLEKP